ncbi:MAG: hypothetical protein FWH29_10500, partial [Methanobrevibacter sp.]|nr:hypothetical protein [Methanobrevibacter sp.]
MIGIAILSSVASVSAADYYVNDSATFGFGNGSSDNPFKTIEEAYTQSGSDGETDSDIYLANDMINTYSSPISTSTTSFFNFFSYGTSGVKATITLISTTGFETQTFYNVTINNANLNTGTQVFETESDVTGTVTVSGTGSATVNGGNVIAITTSGSGNATITTGIVGTVNAGGSGTVDVNGGTVTTVNANGATVNVNSAIATLNANGGAVNVNASVTSVSVG